MSTERRTTGASAHDEPVARIGADHTDNETAHEAGNVHGNGVLLGFRERPYYDEMLLKTHPSKVYFDAFHLYPTAEGYVPVLVSSVLVDKAIRH